MLYPVLIALFAICPMSLVSGWGRDGHREVARIAYKKSTRKAKRFLESLGFPTVESLMEGSTWADTQAASTAYPGSDDLHFFNTPWRNCQPFVLERDCGYEGSGICIVTGLSDMTMRVIDGTLNTTSRSEALKFIVHFMADIHQPLHAGFMEDSGGVHVALSEPRMSLHQFWDFGIFEDRLPEILASLGNGPSLDRDILVPDTIDSRRKMLSFASQLASESAELFTCRFAYQLDSGDYISNRQVLGEDYIVSRRRVAVLRIRSAGRRLADLLDVLASSFEIAAVAAMGSADEQTSVFKTDNYFATLAIDFDPNDFAAFNTSDVVVDAPRPEPPVIQGRNVSEMILVNRNGRFIITLKSRMLEDPDYEPTYVGTFRVKFTGGSETESVLFIVDSACFDNAHIHLTRNELIQILCFFKGIESADIGNELPTGSVKRAVPVGSAIDRVAPSSGEVRRGETVFIGGDHSMQAEIDREMNISMSVQGRKFDAQLALVASGNWSSLESKWEFEVGEQIDNGKVFVSFVGAIQVFFHKDSLTNPACSRMKFVVHPSIELSSGREFFNLIDTRIYNGGMSPAIRESLRRVLSDAESRRNMDTIIQRVTILEEFHDLEVIIANRERTRFKKGGQIIDRFIMYNNPHPYHNYRIIEYSITPDYLAKGIVPEILRTRLGGSITQYLREGLIPARYLPAVDAIKKLQR